MLYGMSQASKLNKYRPPGFAALSIQGGQEPDPFTGARAVPLYQTCSYSFEDAADGASKFAWNKDGYVYTRMGNPTNTVLKTYMAMLEGGVGAPMWQWRLGMPRSPWPSPNATSRDTTLYKHLGFMGAPMTNSGVLDNCGDELARTCAD